MLPRFWPKPSSGKRKAESQFSHEVSPPGAIQTLLNIIPLNPFESLATGNLLQTIFFAIFFGFALSALGEKGAPLARIFDAANAVMIKITAAVMQYARTAFAR